MPRIIRERTIFVRTEEVDPLLRRLADLLDGVAEHDLFLHENQSKSDPLAEACLLRITVETLQKR